MAKLFAMKPILGAKKTKALKEMGFVKEAGQWFKEGTEQELRELWDAIDVYKYPQARFQEKKYFNYNSMLKTKTQGYYVFNDLEIDFYLEVEKQEQVALAA